LTISSRKGRCFEQGRDGIVAHGFPGTGQGAIQGRTLFKFGRIGQLIFQVADLTAEADFGKQADVGFNGGAEQAS
jgi:hypothetical protein